jgi:hypothetical protein
MVACSPSSKEIVFVQQLKVLVSVDAIPASLDPSGAQETRLKKNSLLL